MKFIFKRTIEIEVEGELPLLGYDIKDAFAKSYEKELNEVLSFVKNLEKGKQELDINGKKYYLTVNDKITNIFTKGYK